MYAYFNHVIIKYLSGFGGHVTCHVIRRDGNFGKIFISECGLTGSGNFLIKGNFDITLLSNIYYQ